MKGNELIFCHQMPATVGTLLNEFVAVAGNSFLTVSILDSHLETSSLAALRDYSAGTNYWNVYMRFSHFVRADSEGVFTGFDEVWISRCAPTTEIQFVGALVAPCYQQGDLPEGFLNWFENSEYEVVCGDGHGASIVCQGRAHSGMSRI